MNDPLRSSRHADNLASQPARGFTLIELLFVFGVLALLVALLLPATRSAPHAGRRSHCQNNLKQILLALHTYHDAYGAFPPACTVDASGRPLHSWRTLILPFLDEPALYDSIDLSKAWDDPANASACSARVRGLQCPEADPQQFTTRYLAIVAPGSCLQPAESHRLADVTDAPTQTLILVEVDADHAVPWMAPTDADERLLLSLGSSQTLGHKGVVLAGKVDGSVEAIPIATPANELRSRITIAGGD